MWIYEDVVGQLMASRERPKGECVKKILGEYMHVDDIAKSYLRAKDRAWEEGFDECADNLGGCNPYRDGDDG